MGNFSCVELSQTFTLPNSNSQSRSTCSEECFSLARLKLIHQSCVVLRETFVKLEKSFRGDATTPSQSTFRVFKYFILMTLYKGALTNGYYRYYFLSFFLAGDSQHFVFLVVNQVISKANEPYSRLCPGYGGVGIYIDWYIIIQ